MCDLLTKFTEHVKQAIHINNKYKNEFSLEINILAKSAGVSDEEKSWMVGEVAQAQGYCGNLRFGGRNNTRGDCGHKHGNRVQRGTWPWRQGSKS